MQWIDQIAQVTHSYDIEILCLTHPDRDHYSGMDILVNWIYERGGVIHNLIWFPGPSIREYHAKVGSRLKQLSRAATQDDVNANHALYVQAMNEEAVAVFDALDRIIKDNCKFNRRRKRKGEPHRVRLLSRATGVGLFHACDDVKVYHLGPSQTIVESVSETLWREVANSMSPIAAEVAECSTNAISCILLLSVNGFNLLLTGDTTRRAWELALDEYEMRKQSMSLPDIACDIVKAPHHGSKHSSNRSTWQRALKKNGIAVISAGRSTYWHPNHETLEDILSVSHGGNLYCTNHCPYTTRSLTRKQVTIVEDDSRGVAGAPPLRVSAPARSSLTGQPYHGRCSFAILASGGLNLDIELEPAMRCEYHK